MSLQDEINKLRNLSSKETIIHTLMSQKEEMINKIAEDTYSRICQQLAKEEVYGNANNKHFVRVIYQPVLSCGIFNREPFKGHTEQQAKIFITSITDLVYDYEDHTILLCLAAQNKHQLTLHSTGSLGIQLTESGNHFLDQLSTYCSKDNIIITAKELFITKRKKPFHANEYIEENLLQPLGKNYPGSIRDSHLASTAYLVIEYRLKK